MSDDEYNPTANGGGGQKAIPAKPQKKLTVEKIYQKKSQLEHVLLRPDTYIGSVEPVTEQMWVYDKEKDMMVQQELKYVPGLYKIFDEILVNAADNKQRDPKMDCIKIVINKEQNLISVWNNGKGIPVVEHKDEKMYVPTMIFGHLLTSSNYDDDEKKVTGGRNGYGAKLCNIFSTKFTVETSSKEFGMQLKQTWANNMSKATDPRVSKCTGDDFTKITFHPDLTKFKMTELEDDIIKLMERRAFDIAAACVGVKVYLNGEKVKVKNFKEYADFYLRGIDEADKSTLIYEKVHERWEVAISLSEKGFQQVSFVNSIATYKGGRHVDCIVDQIVKHLIEAFKKKNKGGVAVKPFQIKSHMFIFVNCLIENPTFDSQTKENMTLQVKSFGSKPNLTEKFFKQVDKMGIVESIQAWAKFKESTDLKKQSGKKSSKLRGVAKLEDANDAGTKNSIDCTLILTEGDSAKTLAVSGLSVVGRDKYGIFPLRGKLLNVREATHKQILENAEINSIIKILGLQHKKKYETQDDLKSLRYGKLMIMTDQDQDGSHIKGLLINFIHHFWPSLLRLPFLEEFITPLVKARKKEQELSFFSLPEFEEWKKETNNWHTFTIKYYKGLGTSSAQEAKEYFSDMGRHRIKFNYQGAEDDHNIIMAFSKKEVEKRKEWLTNWMESCKRRTELGLPEEYLYNKTTKSVNYSEFVNKELILFSNMDNERSIPSMVDGFKPGQRKIIYTCLKRNDKKEVKVAQLAGSVAELSSYHHGEVSLMGTIIGLAQDFVGTNNINLLLPNGQFGTRISGGKDAASPRYIFTMLHPLTKLLFHPSDTPLLKNLYDDNQKIEPQWYCPIIPMVLVNGCEGIGTGWSTKVPNFNPREIVENIKRMIHGDEPVAMFPWYRKHTGVMDVVGESRFVTYGEVSVLREEQIEITELPVGKWTTDYKESVLEPMLNPTGNTQPKITDYREYSTDTTVRFVVSLSKDNLAKFEEEGLHKVFKLYQYIHISCMCLFDEMGVLRKYETIAEILKDFFRVRLDLYKKRKSYMEGYLDGQSRKLQNQVRFILEKCSNKLVIENKKKAEMIRELQARGYDSDPEKAWAAKQGRDSNDDESDVAEQEDGHDFNYLLGMSLWSLTHEKKEELLKLKDERMKELSDLQSMSPEKLWIKDLDIFLQELDKWEEKEKHESKKMPVVASAGGKKGAGRAKKNTTVHGDTLPDPNGRRIPPSMDEELRKKAEKLDAAKARPPGATGRAKKRKSDGAEVKDDLDLLIEASSKSLKDRVGTSPEAIEKKAKGALKQTKLNFKKKDSPKKKTTWNSDESDIDGDLSDVDFDSPVRERGPRRTAASKANYKQMLGDSDSAGTDDEDLVFRDTNNGTSPSAPENEGHIIVSDTDDEFESKSNSKKAKKDNESDEEDIFEDVPKPAKSAPAKQSSDQMFDSLFSAGDSQDDDAPPSKPADDPKKKAPAKKRQLLAKEQPEKKKAPPKKRAKKGSDSDEEIFGSSKAAGKKTKKKYNSDSEDNMSDSFEVKVSSKATTGRARKPVSYNFGSGSDSE
ncbi:DNA topoisomerase 2 isoform X2 [Thrips palmi]|nr:DNA topoisomerase 2 isoform X2 [Thrips palmi]